MSSESESEDDLSLDDLFEQVYDYKVNGRYPEHRRRNRGSRGGGAIAPPDLYEGARSSPNFLTKTH